MLLFLLPLHLSAKHWMWRTYFLSFYKEAVKGDIHFRWIQRPVKCGQQTLQYVLKVRARAWVRAMVAVGVSQFNWRTWETPPGRKSEGSNIPCVTGQWDWRDIFLSQVHLDVSKPFTHHSSAPHVNVWCHFLFGGCRKNCGTSTTAAWIDNLDNVLLRRKDWRKTTFIKTSAFQHISWSHTQQSGMQCDD